MVITSTAVAFMLLSLGLAVIGWRFLKSFRRAGSSKIGSKTGLWLSLCFAATAMHNGTLGLGALFFATDPEALYIITIIAHIFLTLLAVIGIYTAYYIFLPHVSPKFSIAITVMISILGLVTAIHAHSQPFLTPQKGIDWNMNFSFALTTFYLLLIGLGVFFYIFTRLYLEAATREVKLLSLVVSSSALIGVVISFIRLVLFNKAPPSVRTSTLDTGIGVIGTIFIVAFIVIPVVRGWIKGRVSNKKS